MLLCVYREITHTAQSIYCITERKRNRSFSPSRYIPTSSKAHFAVCNLVMHIHNEKKMSSNFIQHGK